jgi:hypothetical protein
VVQSHAGAGGVLAQVTAMKPPVRPGAPPADSSTYAPPTPKVSRRKPGRVLTAAEKAAFLASRPDLKRD